MDNYEVLGVRENASKEDIKLAYEKRIKIIDKEVENKKKADLFKGILKNAYDELMINEEAIDNSGQVPQETIMMSVDEINKLLNVTSNDKYDDYYDYEEEEDRKKQRNNKKVKNKKIKTKKKKNHNNRDDKDIDDRKKHNNYKDDDYENKTSSLLLLPLRILAFPIIVVLSVIVFILDIISAIIWLVTKILIILSIVVIAIHGYQVYSGSDMLRYDVLAGCGAAFIIGICLPLVTKIIFDPLKSLNSSLKSFVFHG